MLGELIYSENWAYIYLTASWLVLFLAYSRGSWALQYAAVALWVNWLFANLAVDIESRHAIYIAMDSAFAILAFSFWHRTREVALLTVAGLFSLMVLTHLLASEGWHYLLVLNLLFAGQLYAVGRAASKTPLEPVQT